MELINLKFDFFINIPSIAKIFQRYNDFLYSLEYATIDKKNLLILC
jgi:hypothetical protein